MGGDKSPKVTVILLLANMIIQPLRTSATSEESKWEKTKRNIVQQTNRKHKT